MSKVYKLKKVQMSYLTGVPLYQKLFYIYKPKYIKQDLALDKLVLQPNNDRKVTQTTNLTESG